MEKIEEGQDFKVIVDYAHTPDGFIKVMEYANDIKPNKVIAVFGSAGGDRDKEKRPILGEIADKYCDSIILTQEDNRDEEIKDISKEIAQGIKNTETIFIDDRTKAIEYALSNAKANDIVLILAKADDKYNVVKGEVVAYEGDIDVAHRILKKRGYENEL